MAIEVKVKPKVEIKSRIIVLHSTIKELAEAFGVEKNSLQSINKGIFERQIIKEIKINYINDKKERVGLIKMTIDWEKHQVLGQTSDGKTFKIDSTKSYAEQVADWYKIIINHVDAFRKHHKVEKIQIYYQYRDEIEADKEKYNEALSFMGHIINDKDPWEKDKKDNANFNFFVETIAEKLPELKVTISHNKL